MTKTLVPNRPPRAPAMAGPVIRAHKGSPGCGNQARGSVIQVNFN